MKLKNKTCVVCGKSDKPWFSKKRCVNCAKRSYVKKKETYTDFFTECKKHFLPICQETGEPLSNFSNVNMAHILPKRTYKSVSRDLQNIVILSWNKHTELDNYLDKAEIDKLEQNMPNTFEIIMERLPYLLDNVTERHSQTLKKLCEKRL